MTRVRSGMIRTFDAGPGPCLEQAPELHPCEFVGKGLGMKAVRYGWGDQTQQRKSVGMMVHPKGVSVQRDN